MTCARWMSRASTTVLALTLSGSACVGAVPPGFGGVPAPTPRRIGDTTPPASSPTPVNQPGPGRPAFRGPAYYVLPGGGVAVNPTSYWGNPEDPYGFGRGWARRGTVIVDSSPVIQVSGSYQSRRLRLAFEVNLAGPAIIAPAVFHTAPVLSASLIGGSDWMDWYRWSSWRWYYFYDSTSDTWRAVGREPIFGSLSRVPYDEIDPFVAQGKPWPNGGPARTPVVLEIRKPYTLVDRGDAMLAAGDSKGAVDAYREFVAAHNADADFMRRLSVALLIDGHMLEAVAMMAMAYDSDPLLARTPLDGEPMGLSQSALRERGAQAMAYANRVKTASAYLMALVYMQAQDKEEPAKRVLDKAVNAGLEARIADAWKKALIK